MPSLGPFFIDFRAEPSSLFSFAFEMNRLKSDLTYDAVHAITGLSKQIIYLDVSLDHCEDNKSSFSAPLSNGRKS